jgi:Reverse transcriptase (RNA-dependent DNA polymerase)
MDQPQGFIDQTHPNYVCLLHKSLYGLKQAPRVWFAKLSTTLVSLGFKPSCYDPFLFLSHKNNQTLLVLVYVDDLIITGSNTNQIIECIAQISCQFSIRDLGNINYFLGVQVMANSDGLHLSLAKYISDLLKKTNMINAKPVSSPMAYGTILTQEGSTPCSNPHLYRSIVGSLQYATLTRPEIAFSVNKLSQFMHQPTELHWLAVKRVLRYLCGTLQLGLQISRKSTSQIHAYSDADWAGSTDDRKSTSGFSIFLGSNLVS